MTISSNNASISAYLTGLTTASNAEATTLTKVIKPIILIRRQLTQTSLSDCTVFRVGEAKEDVDPVILTLLLSWSIN